MGDPVQVSLPASEVPRTPAATGSGAGQRMRAIDTLLADRGQLFQALFLSAPIPKALVDLGGHILVANPMLCALTGRTAEELAGRHVDLFAHPDDPPVADLGLVPSPNEPAFLDPHLLLDGERRLRRSDSTELWVVQSHELVRRNDGEAQFVVLSLVDVTDRRRAEEDLVRRAFTDPLTGLPNRLLFQDRLWHALERGRREDTPTCVLIADLDGFKAINEVMPEWYIYVLSVAVASAFGVRSVVGAIKKLKG